MKTVVRVKLLPTETQAHALTTTLVKVNQAANQVSQTVKQRGVHRFYDLQKLVYGEIKPLLGGAQATILVIKKVAEAYKTHRANIRNGRRGAPGSERRAKAEATIIRFTPHSSQPYDDRMLTWRLKDREVSIWVHDTGNGKPGRITVPYTGWDKHLEQLNSRQGQSTLQLEDGKLYLIATIDQEEAAPIKTEGTIGVDLGINRVATLATNTGQDLSFVNGKPIKDRREHNRRLREHLQRVGTKSAKRLLKKRRRKETRWIKDTNHQISKRIVSEAKRTGRGIVLEELTGIRSRVRHRAQHRPTMHSWAFRQLGDYITYKAQREGVPVTFINPAYTSQTCHVCGHVSRKNRPKQDTFTCQKCGTTMNADTNAAINIAKRGHELQVAVNPPNAA